MIFSDCASIQPFQDKSDFDNILLETQIFFFADVEYSSYGVQN